MFISGNVQGVGFRYFTLKNAESLNLKGWVKNSPDGRVEALFEGNPEDVEQMIKRCRKGPAASCVVDVEVQRLSNEEELNSFKVLH